MGIAERKERQRAEIREQILAAARAIVREGGYEALTMRKIADAIEYSPATIYLYFANRDEIGRQLVREAFGELLNYLAPVAAIEDPMERLRAVGRNYVKFGIEQPQSYRLVFMTDPRYGSAVFDTRKAEMADDEPGKRAFAFLIATVLAAQAAGAIDASRDPDLIGEALWTAMHGVVAMALNCADAIDHPPAVIAEALLDALSNGLRTRA